MVVGDLCLPVPFLHVVILPHPSPHFTLPSSPGTGSTKRKEKGEEKEETNDSLPNSSSIPSATNR